MLQFPHALVAREGYFHSSSSAFHPFSDQTPAFRRNAGSLYLLFFPFSWPLLMFSVVLFPFASPRFFETWGQRFRISLSTSCIIMLKKSPRVSSKHGGSGLAISPYGMPRVFSLNTFPTMIPDLNRFLTNLISFLSLIFLLKASKNTPCFEETRGVRLLSTLSYAPSISPSIAYCVPFPALIFLWPRGILFLPAFLRNAGGFPVPVREAHGGLRQSKITG